MKFPTPLRSSVLRFYKSPEKKRSVEYRLFKWKLNKMMDFIDITCPWSQKTWCKWQNVTQKLLYPTETPQLAFHRLLRDWRNMTPDIGDIHKNPMQRDPTHGVCYICRNRNPQIAPGARIECTTQIEPKCLMEFNDGVGKYHTKCFTGCPVSLH